MRKTAAAWECGPSPQRSWEPRAHWLLLRSESQLVACDYLKVRVWLIKTELQLAFRFSLERGTPRLFSSPRGLPQRKRGIAKYRCYQGSEVQNENCARTGLTNSALARAWRTFGLMVVEI